MKLHLQGIPGLVLGSVALLGLAGLACAQSVPDLRISTSAQTWGYVDVNYTSPLLGNAGFQLQMPGSYLNYQPPYRNVPGQIAGMDFRIEAGQGGQDPLYDIVTSGGLYGIRASGRAQVDGLKLRGEMTLATSAASGKAADAPNASAYATAHSNWSQGVYIAPTEQRPAGSFGAILVGLTLEGSFPARGTSSSAQDIESGFADVHLRSSFKDAAGTSFESSFNVYIPSSAPAWAGSITVYKKLLFQFGTPFTLDAWQYAEARDNASADFWQAGAMSYLELPFGASLLSGAEEAGLGDAQALYGRLLNSPSADDPNTNWDFADAGGGFTAPSPVPEPTVPALLLSGLFVLALMRRRLPASAATIGPCRKSTSNSAANSSPWTASSKPQALPKAAAGRA